jgi:ribonucleoside-diphosphate reductase alpha chain
MPERREPVLTDNARRIFDLRYSRKGDSGEPTETPAEAIYRVASNVAVPTIFYSSIDTDKLKQTPSGKPPSPFGGDHVQTGLRQYAWMVQHGKTGNVDPAFHSEAHLLDYFIQGRKAWKHQTARYVDALTDLIFIPNSPTWTGAGTPLGQLAACFVLPIDDDLGRARSSIFQTMTVAALIQQTGGGNGFDFSRLRPSGSVISRSMGAASGPVSFLRVYNDAFGAIQQGGSRRGANMGILRVDHPDLDAFIDAKIVEGQIANFNISVALTDEFMEAVEDEFPYAIKWGGEIVDTRDAEEVFDRLTQSAWKLGDPGCVFIDRANRDNPSPTHYRLEATNPCVTGDTWVLTQYGPRQVDDLVGVDVPLIVNGEAFPMVSDGFFSTGEREVFEVVTTDGHTLRVTSEHPIMTPNGWVETKDLSVGDDVLLHDHGQFAWNGEGTEQQGYLLGLLVGDGSFMGAEASKRAFLCTWGDGHGVEAVRDKAFRCAAALGGVRSDWSGWMGVKGRTEYRMALKPLTDLAASFGLYHRQKHINPLIEQASSDFYVGFLRGIFDADGHVEGNPDARATIRLSGSCLSDLQAIQRMLGRMGMHGRIYSYMRDRKASLPGMKEAQIIEHRLVLGSRSARMFHDRIGFADIEKYAKFEALIHDVCIDESLVFKSSISSIESIGVHSTYDVTVEGAHSFCANGVIVSNCGEQFLPPYSNCCLGHVNVAKFAHSNGDFDWLGFADAVQLGVEFLDDVVDANAYVKEVPELEQAAMDERRIGLGVMGLADALLKLGIPYDNDYGRGFVSKLMEWFRYNAMLASINRAKDRGPFGWVKGSIYDPALLLGCGEGGFVALGTKDDRAMQLWRRPERTQDFYDIDVTWGCPEIFWDSVYSGLIKYGIRNACQTTVAPTGTTSNVVGVEGSGIEPLFALAYTRTVMQEGANIKLDYLSPLFEDALLDWGIPRSEVDSILAQVAANGGSCQGINAIPDELRSVFKVASDIAPIDHVKMQAVCQEFIDNAISKCVVGDTVLATENGLVPIQSLYEDERPDSFREMTLAVASTDGVRKTDAFYYGGERQVRKITLRSGHHVAGTENHRVLVSDSEGLRWKYLAEIEVGDRVAVQYGADMWASYPYRFSFESSPLYGCQKSVTVPEMMTEDLALLLGMYVSEGHISNTTYGITITNSDENVLKRCAELWETVFGLKARITDYDRCPGVVVNSKTLVEFFHYLGVGDTSHFKRVPPAIMQSPLSHVLAFMRGLALDAYTTKDKWAICLASDGLLDDIQDILTNLGIVHSRVKKWNPVYSRFYSEVYASGIHAVNLLNLIPFLEEHKVVLSNRLLRSFAISTADVVPHASKSRFRTMVPASLLSGGKPYATLRNDAEMSWGILQRLVNDGFNVGDDLRWVVERGVHFSPVESVGEWYSAPVYDVSVPETHAFLGNGIVNHNTINMPNEATVEDVRDVYRSAYHWGCKGITIYRQGSREVEVLATAPKVEPLPVSDAFRLELEIGQELEEDTWPLVSPVPLPEYIATEGLPTRTLQVATGFGPMQVYITELRSHPGRLFDVRAQVGKAGNDVTADVEAIGRMASVALRCGAKVSEIVDQLEGIGGRTTAGFGEGRVSSVADALGKLLRRLYLEPEFPPLTMYVTKTAGEHKKTAICPECKNATMVNNSGCSHCTISLGGCGYEAC